MLLVSFKGGWGTQAFPQVRLCTLITPRKHSPISGQNPQQRAELCRMPSGCPWQGEFVLFVENKAGKSSFCFQDKVYFTVCRKNRQLRCSGRFSLWVYFKLWSMFSVKYFSCHFLKLCKTNDIHHSCPKWWISSKPGRKRDFKREGLAIFKINRWGGTESKVRLEFSAVEALAVCLGRM